MVARSFTRHWRALGAACALSALSAPRDGALAQQQLPGIDVAARHRVTRPATRPAAPAIAAAPATAPAPVAPAAGPNLAPPGRGPSGVIGYTASGTSSATKTNTSIMRIPQSVAIITRQQIEDRGNKSLGEALTYAPGVTVAQGEGNRDQITIRGQNTTADFYTDGVRDDAEYYRDLYNVDAVEVLKGPSALIFGRGGGGGVVNRVSKKADGETLRAASFSTGSFARKRVSVDVGQAVTPELAVRMNAMYEHSYGFRDFFKVERYGVNPTLTWRPTEQTYVTLSYEHFHDRRTADRGIPSIGGLTIGGLPIVAAYPANYNREAFFGNPDVNYARVDLDRAALTIDHSFDFGLHVRNSTVFANYDKLYQNSYANGPVTSAGTVNITGYDNATPRQNIFNQTDFTYNWRMTPQISHTLLFGAEVGNQLSASNRNNARFNNPFTGPGSINTPFFVPTVWNAIAFNNPNFRRFTDLDLAAGYVQDQIELTKYVDVVAGVRFDSFDLRFAGVDTSDYVFRTLRRADNKFSPRFGVVLKPMEQLSLYGSYSRSFLPAAGDQFNLLSVTTAALAPQGFENFEIGFKAQLTPRLYLTGALYELNRSNQQVTVGPLTSILTNTRTKGGELSLTGYATDEWQVSLGYGHQHSAIVQAQDFRAIGKVVPSVPSDTFNFWNRYDVSTLLGAPAGTLGLGAGVVYNAKFYAAADNAVVVPGYARVDGAVYVKLSENVTGQLNIENIAGAHYFAAAHNNNNIMPGAPRSAYFTINTKF